MHFNEVNCNFSNEIRSVRLVLCTNGFQPFGQFREQYSSWAVIFTPYNLSPSMYMKREFMFLTVIMPGPNNPTLRIDVFLQPLVKELLDLWFYGVATYCISIRTNFLMRAALMWTINDFPAYIMLSGWITYGKRACPYCMDDTNEFQLRHGGKTFWYDCHRRFLPLSLTTLRRDRVNFLKGKHILRDKPPPLRSDKDILRN
ncbi:hypothetical protein Sjap_004909 [Stephania japonica]|uniref:Uncharacterized protein n=1 Tax=Stephania japonica TaxID=461633 RepID=A0AAP0K308_9MAGN